VKIQLVTLCLSWIVTFSQENLSGIIKYKENNKIIPIAGVNLYWENTSKGTMSDEQGGFALERDLVSNVLIISHLGFKTDTLIVNSNERLDHFLVPDNEDELEEVTLIQRRKSLQKSFIEVQNIIKVSSAELLKAACCNLSESFETNPAIDVSFSDALTGNKQIKMLGLSSPYLLISEENIPMVRGASQAYGLTFTPGTWIESIQISKGAGSVTHGFESIAGEINTELTKPLTDIPFLLNLYRSGNGRFELNSHFNRKLNDRIYFGLYLHENQRKEKFDRNKDGFLDQPLAQQFNIMNRWQYIFPEKGWVSFLSWRWMNDQKQGGTINFESHLDRGRTTNWGSEVKTNRLDASFKLGYVFPELPYQSFGFQSAYSNHDQDSYYGLRIYNINHKSFYTNVLFNSIIGNTLNKFKSGINFSYDEYDEQVNNLNYSRKDQNIGAFFEFSHDNNENFSWIGGVRIDLHNRLGTFVTPRFHLRYLPFEKFVIRLSTGSGRKSANIFAENQTLFATNRKINITNSGGQIYGLRPEKAWNYGLSLSKYFDIGSDDLTVSADYYITDFVDQVVVDWEKSEEVSFYNLTGNSSAKSFQFEVDFSHNLWNFRTAYKNYDVKLDYKSGSLQKPLQARNRFFANVGFESNFTAKDQQWRWDLTYHLVGTQRLVETNRDKANSYSPNYSLWNSQLTRVFSETFELYLGGENIGNYRQTNPIIGGGNPFGPDFDASQVYAPVFGNMIYAGLRFKIKP